MAASKPQIELTPYLPLLKQVGLILAGLLSGVGGSVYVQSGVEAPEAPAAPLVCPVCELCPQIPVESASDPVVEG